MNSTPAASRARRTAVSFGAVIDVSPSASSARLTVATPTADARAKSCARQCKSARAPRIEAVRIVDMSGSNSWAEFAGLFRSTRQAFLEHERSKTELKALMPEDAKEAIGYGIRAKRS